MQNKRVLLIHFYIFCSTFTIFESYIVLLIITNK